MMSRVTKPSLHASTKTEPDAAVRIDKWLWAARFFKTRTLAAEAVKAGHVHVDGQRSKPARDIQPGQTLAIVRGDERFVVRVEALSAQRGPAAVAQTLYTETPESVAAREAARLLRKDAFEGGTKERPTKRDRRAMDRWRSLTE